MKSRTLLLALIIFFSSISLAQNLDARRIDVLLGPGITIVFGDIGDWQIGPSLYSGVSYRFQQNWSVKANLIFGKGLGSDEGTRNHDRGYEFSTFIFEPSLQVEYYFLFLEGRRYNNKGLLLGLPAVGAYGFAGLGGSFFNPTPGGELENNYDDDFTKLSLVVPIGVGARYNLNNDWSVGLEFGRRSTTTDYLDGYTSENSTAKDVYFFGVLSLSYKIFSPAALRSKR
ncbi:MAG: outer membrane beta-barrel protein [Bacteroidetes bacterium]|nr:outer membrane beta-barrel protein [Bacteroidota bacterium]